MPARFSHSACHVTMCVSKLLKRIVAPDLSDEELVKMKDNKKLASHLHTYTHGINSDPITMFAILFSAIIHDVDHPGVSNKQYAQEHPLLGERYRNKSVAEQNSLDGTFAGCVISRVVLPTPGCFSHMNSF